MAYVKSDAPGADEWCTLVDQINDVFNYSLAHATAHALSAQWPGSKVVSFPWPLDVPNQTPDPAQHYACVWLPHPGEEVLTETSNFLCLSGVCHAGSWTESEGLRLFEGVVVDAVPPRKGGEESLHRMIVRTAQALPWMPALPALSLVISTPPTVQEIVDQFGYTIARMKSERDWGAVLDRVIDAAPNFPSSRDWASSCLWVEMEKSIPLFASSIHASELEDATPKVAVGHAKRRI